jgi:hypothetical protein
MKRLIKQLLRENLLLEGEILPYKQSYRNDDGTDLSSMDYNFIANGIRYEVHIGRDRKSRFGEFEASFSVPSQKHSADRTSLDLKHLNNVLETVTAIIDEAVQKYKLRTIKIEGARDEYDVDRFKGDTLRTKLYLRQISKHYPKEAITKSLDWIYVDMTKVYPDLFSDLVKMDTLLELLAQISDEYDFTEDLNNNMVNGENDDSFYIGADYLVNSKLGQFTVEIQVQVHMKEYSIEWSIDDTNENGYESFDNFNSLVNYIKKIFLTPREQAPQEVPQEVPEEEFIGTQALIAVGNKLKTMGYEVKAMKANNLQQLTKPYPQQDNTIFLIHMEDEEEYNIYFMVNDLNVRVIYDKEEKTYLLNIFENFEQRDDEIVSRYYQSIEELLKDIK